MSRTSEAGDRHTVLKVSTMARQCRVSGHPGRLLQDIVDGPAAAEWLVVAIGVNG